MKINKGDTNAAITLLKEPYPLCFSVYEARRRPLKVGIQADVVARVNSAIAPHELDLALAAYCPNIGYLRSLRAGAVRVGLDGNAAGVVRQPEQPRN